MDFLLASYRKQKKWIRLRQLLLLLSRLAVAALLIAMLCGWTGGGQALGVLGGTTTHHVVILDDSYSMGDASAGSNADRARIETAPTAYGRSLQALADLTRRLAVDDGNHQLTVMRASRAAMATRGGSSSGDAAADLSAQTITSDSRLIGRVMSTEASSIRTDLVPALDLATELINSAPADAKYLYIASDFRQRDWAAADRLAESMRKLGPDVSVGMIDCAVQPAANLGITDVSPTQDVWVAGVPVVVNVTVKNYATTEAKNVTLANRIVRYPQDLAATDPTRRFSGEVEPLPSIVIESLAAGQQVTKTFQVFIAQQGTHAIEVSLPEDALSIDNSRSCTLPLSDLEKVLVIDGDADARGAYHIASVLDPGSQVRIGAVPDIRPPAFLRSATLETLAPYRAVYLVDVPEIGENAADALGKYVARGGGLAWFLGRQVSRESYNTTLLAQDRFLLPAPLATPTELAPGEGTDTDVILGEAASTLLAPLESVGQAAFSLVGVSKSWTFEETDLLGEPAVAAESEPESESSPRVRTILARRDGAAMVTQHDVGRGRVITVTTGLDGSWTNWPGDPTFVVFLLQSNALLWSGAAPPVRRFVDDPIEKRLPTESYTADAALLPASNQPPRIPIDITAEQQDAPEQDARPYYQIDMDPTDMVIQGEAEVMEILRPGIAEWSLTRSDGRAEITPLASVIRVGEGDLARAEPAAIQQQLLPLEVKFISSSAWSTENRTAGSSTLSLLMLGLLGLILAAEQSLAYWASYHVKSTAAAVKGGRS